MKLETVAIDTSVLKGEIVHQPFLDEKSLFTIIVIRPDRPELLPSGTRTDLFGCISAKGTFRKAAAGEKLELHGKWRRGQSEYGDAFYFDHFSWQPPDSEANIVEFLCLLPGIGKETAKRIYAKFGKDAAEIAKNQPIRLKEVRGINNKTFEKIMEKHEEIFSMDEVVRAFLPYGISPKKAQRWFEYAKSKKDNKESTIDWMKAHPFSFCKVHGVGFMTADKISDALGFPSDSEDRIIEGFRYVLREAGSNQGHVYLPQDILLTETEKTLYKTGRSVGMARLEDVLGDFLRTEYVKQEGTSIYLREAYDAEVKIAEGVKRLLRKHPPTPRRDFDELIREAEAKSGITFHEKQKDVVRAFSHSRIVIMTGGPGTGKSTTLKAVLHAWREAYPNERIILCAPTGKAAKRMQEITGVAAMTNHRMLGMLPAEDDARLQPRHNAKNPLSQTRVAMDEVSMNDVFVTGAVFDALTENHMLLLIGDEDQLPSVGAGNVLHDLIASGSVPVVRLNTIFRQGNGSPIVNNAARIREGSMEGWIWNKFTEVDASADVFQFHQMIDDASAAKRTIELYQHYLKEGYAYDQIRILSPMRTKTEVGADALNKRLQALINPFTDATNELRLGDRIFRAGDPVMQFKNNYDYDVFNGTSGMVEEVVKGSGIVIRWEDPELPPQFWDREELSSVHLNYASTIHKSQGSEYDIVLLILRKSHSRMLNRRLLYTAATRPKKRLHIIGDHEAMNRALSHHTEIERYSQLERRCAIVRPSAPSPESHARTRHWFGRGV